ncbi:MAG: (2Fe-2S)-binding protein [Anaerolineae bacterium]
MTQTSTYGGKVRVRVDGQEVEAPAGQTIAALLLSLGYRSFNLSKVSHSPRGLFCGQGVCFECEVTLGGGERVRACVTQIEAGMEIHIGEGGRG